MYTDFHRCSCISIDFHRFLVFLWISIDSHGFPLISMDLKGSGARVSDPLCRPVAACGGLWQPVLPDWIPYILRFQILEAWVWMPGGWMLAGLEWIGGGNGGDGWIGAGDWKKFPHARAAGAWRN